MEEGADCPLRFDCNGELAECCSTSKRPVKSSFAEMGDSDNIDGKLILDEESTEWERFEGCCCCGGGGSGKWVGGEGNADSERTEPEFASA